MQNKNLTIKKLKGAAQGYSRQQQRELQVSINRYQDIGLHLGPGQSISTEN